MIGNENCNLVTQSTMNLNLSKDSISEFWAELLHNVDAIDKVYVNVQNSLSKRPFLKPKSQSCCLSVSGNSMTTGSYASNPEI